MLKISAHPSRVQVTLQQNGVVQLQVAGDGDGFTVPDSLDSLVAAGHLGLAGMRDRVRHAGGQFSVVSTPGEGTVVGVTIPISVSSRPAVSRSRARFGPNCPM